MRYLLTLVLALSLGLFSGCTRKKSLWIYTSLYKEVIAELEPALKAAVPEAEIKWFQGGSENVATKLNTELAAGKPQADLILTSDPFWYYELKQNGKLLAYDSPAARKVPARFHDPDHAFVTVRIPMMVLAYQSEAITDPPQGWKELRSPKWKGKLTMGSPLESGTTFTAVAVLSKMLGWEFFSSLRQNELIAAGGNSSVINRVETRERPVGMVLLENILKVQAKGSSIKAVYPSDGIIPVPSPIAILASTKQSENAKKVYDWFFTDVAQKAIVKSGMYSPVPDIGAPEGARSWAEIEKKLFPWTPEFVKDVFAQRETIKNKFSELVLR